MNQEIYNNINCSIDTNVLLRLILGDIPELSEKVSNFFEKNSKKIYIADQVFVEIEYVLYKKYDFQRSQIIQVFEGLFLHPLIVCNKTLFMNVFPEYVKNSKLSLVDIMLSVYAGLHKAEPLYTFDKKLSLQLKNVELL